MSADTPNFYRNEKHAKSQVRELILSYQITAAKTIVPLPRGIDAMVAFDGGFTQQQIDDYLTRPFDGYVSSASTGFTAAQFDTTGMGANAICGIVNMNQQAAYVSGFTATLITGGTAATNGAAGSAGLSASTLETAVGLSPAGDIGFKAVVAGLDAATSGILLIRLHWISK